MDMNAKMKTDDRHRLGRVQTDRFAPNASEEIVVNTTTTTTIAASIAPKDDAVYSMSELEAQNPQQTLSSCRSNPGVSISKSWTGYGNGPVKENDFDRSTSRWQGDTRKTRNQFCRPLAWFASIVLMMMMILYVHQFGKTCAWTPSSHHDPLLPALTEEIDIPVNNITRHESSNNIHGTFNVRDSLVLSTISGNIHATIDIVPLDYTLQTVDSFKKHLRPININIHSTTGNLHIDFTARSRVNAFSRRLFITLKTQTGSMHATDILVGNGGVTEVSTYSGSMHPSFEVLGAGPNDPISHLITRTASKSQHVTVRALGASFSPLAALRGDHRSTLSGSLHVTYPSIWEGKVEGVSRSGSVKIKGRDMMCQSERDDLFRRKKVCYRSIHDGDTRSQETTIFLACETAGSIHFKA